MVLGFEVRGRWNEESFFFFSFTQLQYQSLSDDPTIGHWKSPARI